MKLVVKSGVQEKIVRLYLEERHDGVAVMAEDGRTNWILLKVTEKGVQFASSIPSDLGFTLADKRSLPNLGVLI